MNYEVKNMKYDSRNYELSLEVWTSLVDLCVLVVVEILMLLIDQPLHFS